MTRHESALLSTSSLDPIQSALSDAHVDGWLLYDFRGTNPIATAMLGLEGMQSRRIFAWIPARGTPVAVTHAIEQAPWARWPAGWERRIYASWRSLESEVAALVSGKRVAMEYSPGDAVPVVDRIPAGVLEMVRSAGADVVTSADLVTRFFAVWSAEGLASHRRAAEHLSRIAHAAFARAGAAAAAETPVSEYDLMEWIKAEFAASGLETDHGPNVSATENAANPHYEPSPTAPRRLKRGDAILIDLWATEPGGIYADQTWMACIGRPSPQLTTVWTAVRDARDAALTLLRSRIESQTPVRGADADDAARAVIEGAGFGKYFTHRTGHSMDAHSLHGSGPNLDNLETREERLLIPGVGFSVEPGVYIAGEIGVRSEVNCWVGERELLVTPEAIQQDLIIV
ncbi:MAG: M24 family metallopeptidase [Gemmatimonadetes bacterium]|nr:M24 family metallopeptidase [Gemmatimonadota bacterium]